MEFLLKARSCLWLNHLLLTEAWNKVEASRYEGISVLAYQILREYHIQRDIKGLPQTFIKLNGLHRIFPSALPHWSQLSSPTLVSVHHYWTSQWQPVSIIFHENYTCPPHGNCPLSSHYSSVPFGIRMPHPNHLSIRVVQLVLALLVLRPICLGRCSLPSRSHFFSLLLMVVELFSLGPTSWKDNLTFPPFTISVPHLRFFLSCTGFRFPLQYWIALVPATQEENRFFLHNTLAQESKLFPIVSGICQCTWKFRKLLFISRVYDRHIEKY